MDDSYKIAQIKCRMTIKDPSSPTSDTKFLETYINPDQISYISIDRETPSFYVAFAHGEICHFLPASGSTIDEVVEKLSLYWYAIEEDEDHDGEDGEDDDDPEPYDPGSHGAPYIEIERDQRGFDIQVLGGIGYGGGGSKPAVVDLNVPRLDVWRTPPGPHPYS